MTNDEKNSALQKIANATMSTYHEKMHEFFQANQNGEITDADVIVMIMNVVISTATNVYYSFKQYLPTTVIDYEFTRVTIINALVRQLDEIKQYNPKETTMALTAEQVTEIVEKGFAMIKMPDGSERKIMKEELLIKKEDQDKLIAAKKKEALTNDPPRIITPSGQPFLRH